MNVFRGLVMFGVLAGLVIAAAPPSEPWFIDDEQFAKDVSAKLTALAKKNALLRPNELKKRLTPKTCKLELPAKRDQPLSPEEVYQRALPSVFVVGAVARSDQDRNVWEDGTQASAFALTADGVLATNWHVFEDAGKDRFGVANHKGEVFPVIDILAGDPGADVIIIRVKGEGFTPLPLGDEPGVGAWAGVLSHPGGHLFSFTQGHVNRYQHDKSGKAPADWLVLSADFAVGSSGAPVLDRFGNAVGIAAATITLESDADEPPPMPKARRRKQEPPKMPDAQAVAKGTPQVQMIIKQAVPARVIRRLVQGVVEKP